MTFSFEIHAWRTGRSTDLFYVWFRLGFFSLAFSKLLVSDALEKMRARLDAEDEPEAMAMGEIVNVPHEGFVR